MHPTNTPNNPEEILEIFGAREHNLKNIDLTIPRNKLVVFTGISGSGKSSLAFDTIYAEGQRRYMESFSAYARSFIGNRGAAQWKDLMSIKSTDLALLFPSSKKPQAEIHVLQWVRSRKFTTFCDCCMHVQVRRIRM
jgi:ABC-type molybdenum transport system ATPase subunit/photorepair protein PhrA